jgi:hypothetical protein
VTILHELIHCIQGEYEQVDTESWSAEHDASYMSLLLLFPIKDSLKDSYLPSGKVEEIVLYVYKQILKYHNKSDHLYQGYQFWRDSFGLIKPVKENAFSYAEINPKGTNYLKYLIGFEAYIEKEGSNWKDALLTCFNEDRKGDVIKNKIEIGSSIKINENYFLVKL